MDSLLKVNDDLIKDDAEIEGFLKSLEKKIAELDEKPALYIQVNNNSQKINDGIQIFEWDENRFPRNQKTIEEILVKINEKFNATRQNLKVKTDEFNLERDKLKAMEKANNEALTLMKYDYREIVKKTKDKIVTTDFMSTVLCFVPNNIKENFLKNYMKLAGGMVLPLSALQLDKGEDEKTSLYRVVVMTHAKDDFRNQCSGILRIQCRDYDEEEIRKKEKEENKEEENEEDKAGENKEDGKREPDLKYIDPDRVLEILIQFNEDKKKKVKEDSKFFYYITFFTYSIKGCICWRLFF